METATIGGFFRFLNGLIDGETTIARNHLSGDIAGEVAGQEEGDVCHISIEATATERDFCHPILAYILGELLGHGSLDKAGSNGVAANIARAEFLGDGTREADDSSLGGRIVALTRIAVEANDRADVDDRAGTLLHHHGGKGLGVVEDRTEVDLKDEIPVLDTHAEDELVFGDTSIVDEDVEASVVVGNPLGDIHSLGVVGSIAGEEVGTDTLGTEFGEEGLAVLVLLEVSEDDVGTFLGEEEGMAASNAS